MPRPKSIGWLMKRDPAAARAEILDAITLAGGNVRRAAFIIGIGQPWLCRLIVRLNLRGEVAIARTRAERPEWLINARRVLSMDERIQEIVAGCQGKSEDEIREMIESSASADSFEDPGLVAAYVASLAGGAA